MVQSAGMTVTAPGTIMDLATDRVVVLALMAAAAFGAGWLLPKGWATRRSVAVGGLAAATILLVAVLVPSIGREVNGARRWITIGPVGFQPSELAKWAMVLFIAWFAVTRSGGLRTWSRGTLPAAAVIGLVCGLVVLEDLGTAIMIGLVATMLLLASGASMKHLAAVATVGAGGVVVAILAAPYRIARLQTFLDPWADPAGAGYHVIQSMKALAGGGLGGRGLGTGIQKFGYLPEDTTDFIFAIVVEELGFAGCVLVVALLAGLVWAGWSIVQQQRSPHAQLLALGITATVALQGLVNLLVVTGLAPTKGIALPLVSSGGTGWLLTAFMLGLLARLDPTPRRTARSPSATPAGPRL